MTVPDIGTLRHRLILEKPREILGDDGGRFITWEPSGEIWAAIIGQGAAERVDGDRLITENSTRIILRHRPDIESGMRFRKGDRVFLIKTVRDPDERGRFLRCETVESGR